MSQADVTVYQAEWCPFSARVRQRLTELGVPYVAIAAAPQREERDEMEEAVGSRVIPVVVLGDGTVLDGDASEIVTQLDERFEPKTPDWAAGHRAQAEAHGSVV